MLITPVSNIRYWPLMPISVPSTTGFLSKLWDLILSGKFKSSSGLGVGLVGSQRLMDDFHIQSEVSQGTKITGSPENEKGPIPIWDLLTGVSPLGTTPLCMDTEIGCQGCPSALFCIRKASTRPIPPKNRADAK